MVDLEQKNMIFEGLHYATGKVIRMGIRNGLIISLADIDEVYWTGEQNRDKLPVIAPGLVDLQINGYQGIDFNDEDLKPGQVEDVSAKLLNVGVTRYFPTLITASRKKISKQLGTFSRVIRQKGLASHMIGGIHLEGPFISGEDGPRGAHPKRFCLKPDPSLLERWQEEAGGHIRIITMAPELPGSIALMKACVMTGIIVAIGHTSASSEEIRSAVSAGATLSTHLGNGAHRMLPRHPNYIWDQLAENALYASMIADGFHLPESVLRVFMRTKKKKAILISDGMPYSGLDPGIYDSPVAGRIRLTSEGKLHREGDPGLLTGSASTLLNGVMNVSRMEGLACAWDMGSLHPAQLLNHSSSHGLQVGAPADLVFLDSDTEHLKILKVLKGGVQWSF
jgi:N-acetylglucosamine-6-phosphate deacetylase